jgi:protein-L-isoaspartate(D-aspartate) O-methyltransferase
MDKSTLLSSLKEKEFNREIVQAFSEVKREDFVPAHLAPYAYEDMALPTEVGSTISQPYTIAFMLSLLNPKENQKILEIGSGSGYVLALLSKIIKKGELYGLEINKSLAIKSMKLLDSDPNIDIILKSGFSGFPSKAPFDRILVSAACPDMRIPLQLTDQLSPNGIMIAPVQSSIYQFTKSPDGKIQKREFPGFAFVPLREE